MIATHQSIKWRIVLRDLIRQFCFRAYAQLCIKSISPALLMSVLSINSHANTEIEELRPRIGQEWVQVQNVDILPALKVRGFLLQDAHVRAHTSPSHKDIPIP